MAAVNRCHAMQRVKSSGEHHMPQTRKDVAYGINTPTFRTQRKAMPCTSTTIATLQRKTRKTRGN